MTRLWKPEIDQMQQKLLALNPCRPGERHET